MHAAGFTRASSLASAAWLITPIAYCASQQRQRDQLSYFANILMLDICAACSVKINVGLLLYSAVLSVGSIQLCSLCYFQGLFSECIRTLLILH